MMSKRIPKATLVVVVLVTMMGSLLAKFDAGPKTASGEFWELTSESASENGSSALEPCREKCLEVTMIVSGIPYWISRDPIEEEGGVNVYRMLNNDPVQAVDFLGLKRVPKLVHGPKVKFKHEDALGGRLTVALILSSRDTALTAIASAVSHLGILITDTQEVSGDARVSVKCICKPNGEWVPIMAEENFSGNKSRVEVEFKISKSVSGGIATAEIQGRARSENLFSGSIPFAKAGILIPFLGEAADQKGSLEAHWTCEEEN